MIKKSLRAYIIRCGMGLFSFSVRCAADARKLRPHLCLVLDQSNAYHCRTSFFRNFSSFYCNTK